MNHEADLGKVLSFMRELWAVDHALRSASKRMARRIGLTGPQRLVVRLLGRFPGANAGEIAELLHLDPSTLSGILARLESRGLIQRGSDEQDGRRALFELTEAGRGFDKERAGTVEAAVQRALARLSAQKVRAARAVLEAVVAELARDGETPAAPPRTRSPVRAIGL